MHKEEGYVNTKYKNTDSQQNIKGGEGAVCSLITPLRCYRMLIIDNLPESFYRPNPALAKLSIEHLAKRYNHFPFVVKKLLPRIMIIVPDIANDVIRTRSGASRYGVS